MATSMTTTGGRTSVAAESIAEAAGEVITRVFWYTTATVLVASSLAVVTVKKVTERAVDAVTPPE